MRVLWIDPIVEDKPYAAALASALWAARRAGTDVDILSLPPGHRPRHLRYHAYEALVMADIATAVWQHADEYDAFVIGCFYDLALREAREVSGKAIVTAPCQSSIAIASHLGNTFSVLTGASKAIPKMRENIRAYGFEHRLGVHASLEYGRAGVSDASRTHYGGDAARGAKSGGRRRRRGHRTGMQRRNRIPPNIAGRTGRSGY